MKLTPEEIRAKAREWSKSHMPTHDAIEKSLLGFLEDVTGEKLPEPFDESKVVHGSVWAHHLRGRVLIISGPKPNTNTVLTLCVWDRCCGSPCPSWGNNTTFIASILKADNWQYLGQYDFAAGLPK